MHDNVFSNGMTLNYKQKGWVKSFRKLKLNFANETRWNRNYSRRVKIHKNDFARKLSELEWFWSLEKLKI